MSEFKTDTDHEDYEIREPERPKDLEEFLHLQEQFIKEAAEIREGQIRELAGDPPAEGADPSEIDSYKISREAAEDLIEEDYLRDPHRWEEIRRKGLITVIPPAAEMWDKRTMVSLWSDHPTVYSIFNDAAHSVTNPYGGQHQIGHNNSAGITSWELLWTGKNKPAPKSYRLIEDVHKIMSEYNISKPGSNE